MMDTSQRIARLCDGDNRLIFQGLGDSVTIEALQAEYLPWLWYDQCMEVVVVLKDLFTPTIVQMWETFKKSLGQISNADIAPISKTHRKDWKRYKQTSCNNFRKHHNLPMMRRCRCRWRPRESRRSLDGLSPGIVIIDEIHEWK